MHDHPHDRPPTHEPGPGTHELSPGDRTLLPKVHIELEVRDEDGDLVDRKQAAANLATDNWIEFMGEMLTNAETAREANMTNKNGNSGSATTWEDGNYNLWFEYGPGRGVRLAIGDGGGASVNPQRGNHDLDNELGLSAPIAPDKGTNTLVWSTAFTNDSGGTWTIRETGWFIEGGYEDNPGPYLMFHDAVADTNVADGQSVTLTYTFEWP
jgi:hypothetical protein